jgi:hypothetical protein
MQNTKWSLGLLILAGVMVTGKLLADGPPPPSAPDAGSSALLASMALGGLALVRKYFR